LHRGYLLVSYASGFLAVNIFFAACPHLLKDQAVGRDMAVWLCRRWTSATLAQLGSSFGLSGSDSVFNLVRRAEKCHQQSRNWRKTAKAIEATLGLNTEHKALPKPFLGPTAWSFT